jgi:hypothetical protein
MAGEEVATLRIPQEVLTPIISARVNAALLEVFDEKNQGRLVQELIHRVLTAKVDDRGEPDRHGSHNAITTIEWLVRKAIRDAVNDAVREALKVHKDVLQAQLVKELKRSDSKLVRHLATTMVEGMAQTAETASYRFSVEYKEPGHGR